MSGPRPHNKLKQRLVQNAIRNELPTGCGDDEFYELMAVVKARTMSSTDQSTNSTAS